MDRVSDLYLHIGTDKTGTSSIQHYFASNRETLAAQGVLYPVSAGNARHLKLGFFIKDDERLEQMPNWRRGLGRLNTPQQFRRKFRRAFLAEVADSAAASMVMSDEALYPVPDEALTRLRRILSRVAERTHIVVYLRRQDDHLISRYQQAVKTGETTRLSEFACHSRDRFYDYGARLETWIDALDPASVRVRPFERGQFLDASIYKDFLAAIDQADLHEVLDPLPSARNESLDADAVEFLRLLNILRIDYDGVERPLIDHRPLVPVLAQHLDGPVLTLPEHELTRFMQRWLETNRAVAHRYLGSDDGVLFRADRKAGRLTTQQHLDEPTAVSMFNLLAWEPADQDRFLQVMADQYGT